jgi:hypothetical protein
MRAISVDRTSYKDASTKQTQDYRNFNHLSAPIYYGYFDNRSWFRAGFVGAGRWFRLMPRRGPWSAAIPAASRAVDHCGRAGASRPTDAQRFGPALKRRGDWPGSGSTSGSRRAKPIREADPTGQVMMRARKGVVPFIQASKTPRGCVYRNPCPGLSNDGIG